MRKILTLLGVALVVAGLLLALVPLFAGPSKVLTPSQSVVAFNATTPISLTGAWPIGLSWSSNRAVSLLVVICQSVNQSASSLATICPGAALTRLSGTSGTETFNVPLGGVLLIGIVSNLSSGLAVKVALRPALAFLGTIVVIGGGGIVVVGVLARRPTPKLPTTPEPPA